MHTLTFKLFGSDNQNSTGIHDRFCEVADHHVYASDHFCLIILLKIKFSMNFTVGYKFGIARFDS